MANKLSKRANTDSLAYKIGTGLGILIVVTVVVAMIAVTVKIIQSIL